MAANYFRELCRTYLSPVLEPAGYLQTGLTFRARSGATWRLVDLSPSRTSSAALRLFVVEIGAYRVPDRPYLSADLRAELDAALPGVFKGQFRAYVKPSAASGSERLTSIPTIGEWAVQPEDDVDRIGRELADAVAAEALPCLDSLVATGDGPTDNQWPALAVHHVAAPFRDRRTPPPGGLESIYALD